MYYPLTVIALISLVCLLLFLLFLEKRELQNVTRQLQEIGKENTNLLIGSESGVADKLICEINILLKEVREIRATYSQKKHALEQMMTNISHDLRTPLTSALGYIHIIQHSELSEEEKSRELAIVEKRLIRLEELIDSFFELSQVVSAGKQPEKSEVNLVSILEESMVHYYDDYCAKDRQIIFQCKEHKLMLDSNPSMLLRIFDNLISNALKHGKGDLLLSLSVLNNIQIVFENELDSSRIDVEHVFDEFYTTDIARTKGNTGLGLAIAKQFTELLNGTIQAEFRGNRFICTVVFYPG